MKGDRLIDIRPRMEWGFLEVDTDAGVSAIPSPGAGKALRIYGYVITEQQQANATINAPAYLRFAAQSPLWQGITLTTGSHYRNVISVSGLTLTGEANGDINLHNSDVNAAVGIVTAHVFYGIVYR